MTVDARHLPGRQALSFATSRDELRAPTAPRLRPGTRYLVLPDAVQFDGLVAREVIKGPGAVRLLPVLLPLLDGTRDATALARATAYPQSQIDQVLAVLHLRGLLEEGADAPSLADASPAQLALARLGTTTRVDPHAGHTFARLAAARIVLHGPETMVGPLAEALERAGVGSIGGTVAGADLVVAVVGTGGLDRAAAGELGDECAREGTTFLPVDVAGRVITIGPLLVPETPLCYACLCAELGDSDATVTADPLLHCGILCREVLAFAARVPETRITRSLVRYDLSDWTTTLAAPAPRLDCATCLPVSGAAASDAAAQARTERILTPLRFELATAGNPVRFAAGTGPLASIEPRNIAATHGGKQWPSARRIHLADPGEGPPPSLAGLHGRPLSLDVLALILSRTAGLRDPQTSPTDRWAPSGGNIGSVHLHLRARGLPDLADGWYGYDSVEHALAVLREVPAEGGPDALIVFTGGYRRLVGKYGPFAVRLLAFDTGVALAQLDFVARSLTRELEVLDETPTRDLTDALLLEPDREPVTAIVRLT
ncbi:hypothetical protein [Streptomyces sp. NL15-2K]|uniref:hypothetical protein n=1 Tax=Streptomyces sp. NL15-2K TaxID=376149 RepID=UPI000F572D63|nr:MULTISPECIES: hypothetical protein [Actinomycetes]WKX10318.1 hypothetical protein Q4V64_23545 [Kutzneria buriramensis]GCB48183.1 hypothetical protein SNL152K_5507 [Streptomyces sp. NL15-2K]